MRRSRLFWITRGLTALMASALLVPAAAWSQRFAETTEVVVVEVPVQVVRDGEPVRGLTAEDFEIVDGKKKQQIIGFDTIDLSLTGPATAQEVAVAEVPVSARRHFLLLFDISFSDPTSKNWRF